MPQLTRADAEKLLRFVADAESLEGLDPFTTELLDQLGTVLQCDFATFYTFDPIARVGYDYVPCSLESRYAAPTRGWSGVPEYADVRVTTVGLWSDTLDRTSRWRYEGASFASAFDVVDCAWTVIDSGPGKAGMLSLHRQGRDFTERDRLCVGALRPHISALVRNAHARRRLADLMAAVDSADAREPQGFLLLSSGDEIDHASPSARHLLSRWFDGLDSRLPTAVGDWLRSDARREPLVVEAVGQRLVVVAPTRGGLVLTEQVAPPASLTSRELEVLRGIAAGGSTAEIARLLWVTPATVSKHLEHIYRKLGVSSRTAAVAAAGIGARSLQ